MVDGSIGPIPSAGNMALSHKFPRCGAGARDRILAALDAGCTCGAHTATIRRRNIASRATTNPVVTIHLQCDGCGRSLIGALPRKEFYFFQDLSEWDESIREKYWSKEEKEYARRRAELNDARDDRRREYDEWLLNSPAWHRLRNAVVARSGGVCEACLEERASEVHHDTYELGKLPPAWELHAVCRACHKRLHDGWRRDFLGGEE